MKKIFTLWLSILASLSAEKIDSAMVGPGIEVNLISASKNIAPGRSLTLGFHLKHLPGFHSYWQNPGIVGVPTSIKWKLPEGFSASEIRWPYPEKTLMGPHPCHGYERDVTLLVTIEVPKKIEQKEITLKAETSWMACAKGCFPGHKDLEITLPVAEAIQPNPKTLPLFAKSRSEMPKIDKSFKATLLSKPDAKVIEMRIFSDKKLSSENVYFFSTDGQVASDKKQTVRSNKRGGIKISVERSEFSPENQKTVPGVLKLGEEYYAIDATPRR